MKRLALFLSLFLVSVPVAASCKNQSHEPDVSIEKYYGGKRAAVCFTYDDGVIDHYSLVAPHLDEQKIPGTFFVIGSSMDSPGTSGIGWKEAEDMNRRGHLIANHSWTHGRLVELSDEGIRDELKRTDDAIEAHLGRRPLVVAVPFNEVDARIKSIILENHIGVRTYQKGQGQGKAFGQGSRYCTLPQMKAWLDGVIENGELGITMTHGIRIGWDKWENEDEYWEFIRYAGSRSDDVWYATFEAVCAYEAEREACTMETGVDGRTVSIVPHCTLPREKYSQPLTVRVSFGGESKLVDVDPFGGPVQVRF